MEEGIPEVQDELPGECSWKELNSQRVFLESRMSFLEGVAGRESAPRGLSEHSGRASLKVFLERYHEAISGVKEEVPGECSWKGMGITRLILELRKSFLKSVLAKE